MVRYRTVKKSSCTLKHRITLGLPRSYPALTPHYAVYGVNTTYLLHVTVSYDVLRLEPVIPQAPVD